MIRKVLGGDPIDPLLPDMAARNWMLAEISYEPVRDGVAEGIASARTVSTVGQLLDIFNPLVTDFLSEYVGLMANRVNRTFVERVREVLIEGLREGVTYRDMRNDVLEAMGCQRNEKGRIVADKGAKASAQRIVRTESRRAYNAGRMMQLKESGAVRKVWQANLSTACEFCIPLHGKTIEIDQMFFKRGDVYTIEDEEGAEHRLKLDYCDTPHPPIHPNCNCFLVYEWD
jgi:hypothetical protein